MNSTNVLIERLISSLADNFDSLDTGQKVAFLGILAALQNDSNRHRKPIEQTLSEVRQALWEERNA